MSFGEARWSGNFEALLGTHGIGESCTRELLVYRDRDVGFMPLPWYFRRDFLLAKCSENFIVLCFVCGMHSGNGSSYSGMILIIFGRDVLTSSSSLHWGS